MPVRSLIGTATAHIPGTIIPSLTAWPARRCGFDHPTDVIRDAVKAGKPLGIGRNHLPDLFIASAASRAREPAETPRGRSAADIEAEGADGKGTFDPVNAERVHAAAHEQIDRVAGLLRQTLQRRPGDVANAETVGR